MKYTSTMEHMPDRSLWGTGLNSSHQRHAVVKVYWFHVSLNLFNAYQTTSMPQKDMECVGCQIRVSQNERGGAAVFVVRGGLGGLFCGCIQAASWISLSHWSGKIITTSLGIIEVNKGNHPQMALFQVSELV